jgi:2-polyprenyl-3-methyl-5-hydroxy-6-metoxy-1,4-benzoquinol methylase
MTNKFSKESFSSSERRWPYEYRIALDCIIPCLKRWGIVLQDIRVLDLGCGSGGVTIGLAENGAKCLGLDHNDSHIKQARRMASDHAVDVKFDCIDALDFDQLRSKLDREQFDLIVLSEFVEHLVNDRNVAEVLNCLKNYLTTNGNIYVSFPPWFSPFAGHQAGWPVIRFIPWFHITPDVLKYVIAPTHTRRYLHFARELNRLTISSFEQILMQIPLAIIKKELFHLRPEFKLRYGIPTIQSSVCAKIPFIREITTTGAFYLLGLRPGIDLCKQYPIPTLERRN